MCGCNDDMAPNVPLWSLMVALVLIAALTVGFWVLVGWACVTWL